jgi:hypothetical protein
MVLGAVLHHDGAACLDGALGGSGEAIKLARKNLRSYDLASLHHLQNKEGQFGAAYKGSLINLGVFKTDEVAVNDDASLETSELCRNAGRRQGPGSARSASYPAANNGSPRLSARCGPWTGQSYLRSGNSASVTPCT